MELQNTSPIWSSLKINLVDNGLDVIENVTESYKMIISDDVMWQLTLYVYILLCGAMAFFGIITNSISVIIYYRLGLKDSMSVCLFALSITDCMVSLFIVLGRVCHVWNIFFSKDTIDPLALCHAGPAWFADSLFLCSGWILTFMSLERCVCVVFPFKVKQIFTKNRSIVAVVLIHVITASTFIPIYATHWLGWVHLKAKPGNGTAMKSRLVLMHADNRKEVQEYVAVFSSTIVPVPPLVLTFVSVLWMTYALNISSKLRDSMTAKSAEGDGGKANSKLTQKTRRLVKVVLFLSIVFLFCSVPRILGTCIQVINPEISAGGKEKNLNNVIWNLARIGAALNAFINIFIYLKINSSYQDKFREIFSYSKR